MSNELVLAMLAMGATSEDILKEERNERVKTYVVYKVFTSWNDPRHPHLIECKGFPSELGACSYIYERQSRFGGEFEIHIEWR